MNISTRRGESINSVFSFTLGYCLCYLPTCIVMNKKREEIANKNTINSGKLMREIVRIETLSEKTQAIPPQLLCATQTSPEISPQTQNKSSYCYCIVTKEKNVPADTLISMSCLLHNQTND